MRRYRKKKFHSLSERKRKSKGRRLLLKVRNMKRTAQK
jgi:hypothetical protein